MFQYVPNHSKFLTRAAYLCVKQWNEERGWFCYSILGMYLFGGKFCMLADGSRECDCEEIIKKDPKCVCDRKHFNNVLWATVTVFQVGATLSPLHSTHSTHISHATRYTTITSNLSPNSFQIYDSVFHPKGFLFCSW